MFNNIHINSLKAKKHPIVAKLFKILQKIYVLTLKKEKIITKTSYENILFNIHVE